MALDTYLQRTQLLLNDVNFEIYNEGDLTTYINMARGQIAGESECVRVMGTLAVVAASQQYRFTAIDITVSGGLTVSGVQGVLHVRQATFNVASGQKPMYVRAFPYFNQYFLADPSPTAGPPHEWSQYGQGTLGTLYVNLLDGPYTLNLDTVCYPLDLTDDTTAESIPYQFTDAIPFLAAYYAALTKDADMADKMWNEYQKFMTRARGAANPSVVPASFSQSPDQVVTNRLGLAPAQTRGE